MKRTSWWSSRTWFVFTSSLIILIIRRRSFWTTRTWTSQFLSNSLPDDWIHRRKEIQNGCREITVERERSGNYTENITGLFIDRVKIRLDCVKKKMDSVKIKTGLCKTITVLSKSNTGLWPSWAIVSLQQTIPVLQHGAHSECLRALQKPVRSWACLRSIKVPNTSFNFVNKPSVRLLNARFSFSRPSPLLIIYQTTFVVLFVIELYWPGGSICTSLRGIVRRYLNA